MDEVFNKINYSIDWGLLFSVIGFVSLTIAWLKKIFRLPVTHLTLKHVSFSTPILKEDELNKHLKILFNGKEIEQLNRLDIYIQNSGSKTLNAEDFHILPKINLTGFTNITSLRVSTSNKFTKWEPIFNNDSELSLKVLDFESRNYMRIEVLFESLSNHFEPFFEFQLKEKEIEKRNLNSFGDSRMYSEMNASNFYMYSVAVMALYTLAVTYFTTVYALKIDLSQLSKIGIGWKILYYTPTVIVSIITYYKWNKYVNKTYYEVGTIKTWHTSQLLFRS